MNFLLKDTEFIANADLINEFCRNNVKVSFTYRDNYKLCVLELIPMVYTDTLVIVPGRGEIEFKYQELLFSLRNLEKHIMIVFVRGQGHSSNTITNSRASYIENFKEYTDDLAYVLSTHGINRFSLMGFSLGGLIALSYSLKYPIQPQKLCLLAPYSYPYTNLSDGMLNMVAKTFAKLKAKSYIPHHGNYKRIDFAKNVHSHSQIRYEHYHNYYAANPHLVPGGITYGFLKSCLQEQNYLQNCNVQFNFPLMILAAQNDKIVSTVHSEKLAHHLATLGNKVYFKTINKAYHDLLNEEDSIRDEALYTAFNFLWKV